VRGWVLVGCLATVVACLAAVVGCLAAVVACQTKAPPPQSAEQAFEAIIAQVGIGGARPEALATTLEAGLAAEAIPASKRAALARGAVAALILEAAEARAAGRPMSGFTKAARTRYAGRLAAALRARVTGERPPWGPPPPSGYTALRWEQVHHSTRAALSPLVGQRVALAGFVVPADGAAFRLVKLPGEVCAGHPGAHHPGLTVTHQAAPSTGWPVQVTGVLRLSDGDAAGGAPSGYRLSLEADRVRILDGG
jgi:hypothetical protein